MEAKEFNFDGLVGPTHNYAGLSFGNIASTGHQGERSNPREAALQGLDKMAQAIDLGLFQGILPPHQRPDIITLKRLGLSGSDGEILEKVLKQAPHLLAAISSASAMWTANAATVSPSADTDDGRVHFTPANLTNKFHRSIEVEQTARSLKAIFKSEKYFKHHQALPSQDHFGDEGAANHTRFCQNHGDQGVELFVYGKESFNPQRSRPKVFPARHSLEAAQAVARLHQLGDRAIFAQQNPEVIDAGVFHNDVIAVGNRHVLFCHEDAFCDQAGLLATLEKKISEFKAVVVKRSQVSVADCVKSYLFNSQLVDLNGEMALIAPQDCRETNSVKSYLENLTGPIKKIIYQDLRQSMNNGGGPACLRLRVVLTEKEVKGVNSACLLNLEKINKVRDWVKKHYRDRLELRDLADPQLIGEVYTALDELTQILKLGPIYPFQH